jgi:hypothetical protein
MSGSSVAAITNDNLDVKAEYRIVSSTLATAKGAAKVA